MNQVVIGVGSNIDPEKNIDAARDQLLADYPSLKESTRLITKPIGITDQPDFTNCAFLLETELNFDRFTSILKTIEQGLGRDYSGEEFGPRTIDLDIVVWNGEIKDPEFHTRSFLQKNVTELLPNLA